mmetsp:Transcript_168262/g.540577  ORF Transcript_168262/g.540577 Transcript_168262/m.540577 type:complete len:557 (+) Transcript_168262:65-1735(+)
MGIGKSVGGCCYTRERDDDGDGKSAKMPSARVGQKHASLVDLAAMKSSAGAIAVAGRYCTGTDISADYIMVDKVLGAGMSGDVKLATSRHGGKRVAMKSFKKLDLAADTLAELKNEVEVFLQLDHPHIARLERVYESDSHIHLVMELMAGGELFGRLAEADTYTEENAAKTTYMMLLAIAYLHANNLAHRDLKLENFLYEAKEGPHKDHLKLIDFGLSKFYDEDEHMKQACGTLHYIAPEVLKHKYTQKADLWSLGVIVYMLLTGGPPFVGTEKKVLAQIAAGKPQWSASWHKLSEGAQHFVKKLLVLDPEARYSAEEALKDEWITSRETNHAPLDRSTVESLKNFGSASSFKRAMLSMMAWNLDTNERSELREIFLAMDTEQKGTLTLSQVKTVLEDMFQVESEEAENLFKMIDSNNDNEVAYTEFLAAACVSRVKVHEDLLRKTFARFDVDGSGQITIDDLRSVLGDEFEGMKIEDFISEVDTNNDGVLDYEEFIAYFFKSDAGASEDKASMKQMASEKMSAVVDRLAKEEGADKDAAATPPVATMVRRKSTVV